MAALVFTIRYRIPFAVCPTKGLNGGTCRPTALYRPHRYIRVGRGPALGGLVTKGCKDLREGWLFDQRFRSPSSPGADPYCGAMDERVDERLLVAGIGAVALAFLVVSAAQLFFSMGSSSSASVVFGTSSWPSPGSGPNWCATNQAREAESTSTRPKNTSARSLKVAGTRATEGKG